MAAVFFPMHQPFATPLASFARCALAPVLTPSRITELYTQLAELVPCPHTIHLPRPQNIQCIIHAPCRCSSSNAVRPLSHARSGNALNKSYEESHRQAIKFEVDYSQAVYLPSWESHASTRAGACPLQWLPLLLAFHDDSSTSPSDGDIIEALAIRASPVSARFGTGAGGARALSAGMRYAINSSDLIAALSDSAVSRIVLTAGTYEFANDMCDDDGGAALCIDRTVTIEAEVAGSVVLDAKGARRVMYVSGKAELIGLNITGGASVWACARQLNLP